ncbi:MAG TPA: FAD:protein FMN transferase [Spirochaetota bacterium]|nr:FAD:protein FMN transferase [Spirochaetota bacterium]HOS33286.1 FAD:protein FMN transferase [Spirochaetota bacterium]HOS55211.1 FAD:protein FMN transferase [Spirochaetota bacterium]HQF78564.1 FAD:protein FMN transferase [Spirochaetota bacterium]HQH30435.1 FAD:protein FMN transferase [Spirochaetota bacterium]
MLIKKTIFALLFISFALFSRDYKKYSKSEFAMGTNLAVTFFSYDGKKNANKILAECFRLAGDLEKKVSCKNAISTIYKLNSVKKGDVSDDFTLELLKNSLYYAELTDGLFDPALYNVIELWGFESGENKIPEIKEILAALKSSGYKNVAIDGKTIVLSNGASLDLGGIAKGAIIGKIAEYLKSVGLKDFLINGGGDIVVGGLYAGQRKWRIAIANPFNQNETVGMVELTDCSVVTSGDYERYFISEDGIRYHHIIDPRTGTPANNGVHSATVIADSPVKADALSTALFVAGVKEALELVKKTTGVKTIFISGNKEDFKLDYSDNISHTIRDGKYYFEVKE